MKLGQAFDPRNSPLPQAGDGHNAQGRLIGDKVAQSSGTAARHGRAATHLHHLLTQQLAEFRGGGR